MGLNMSVPKALYKSKSGIIEVDVETFYRHATPLYKERDEHPFCPACKEKLHTRAALTPEGSPCFCHYPHHESDDLDICSLSSHTNRRLSVLRPTSWDHDAAKKTKAAFLEPGNLKTAYSFMWRLCGKGNLPTEIMQQIIRRADKHNIWAYKNMPLWFIPYILLALANFAGTNKKGDPENFHFVIHKPRGTSASTIESCWEDEGRSQLKKFNTDTAAPILKWSKVDDQWTSQPFSIPISQEAFLETAGKPDWVTDGTLTAIRGESDSCPLKYR